MTNYDIAIVGGGLVGSSLAIAVAGHDLKVAVIEPRSLHEVDLSKDSARAARSDGRAIVLGPSSQRIFSTMGLWQGLEPSTTPIKKIHISDRGHFGTARISAEEEGLAALGYVIDSYDITSSLARMAESLGNTNFISPARLIDLEQQERHVALSIDRDGQQQRLTARLVIGADGTRSAVRRLLGIGVEQRDYQQFAITSNVKVSTAEKYVAYERFTESGPLALLPAPDGHYNVVWSVKSNEIETYMDMPDQEFLHALQTRFGGRIGKMSELGPRQRFPLSLVSAQRHIDKRVVLIGNAAHTLHPIAGQGFNLGLRDVAVLAQLVVDAAASGQDVGAAEVLTGYEKWRHKDQRNIIGFTDGLVRLFSTRAMPCVMARGLGMLAVNSVPPLKRLLTRHAMGLSGHQPRLTRGLPV